jgi:hypothetical protein
MDALDTSQIHQKAAEKHRARERERLTEVDRAKYDLIALREREKLREDKELRQQSAEDDRSRLRQNILTGEPVPVLEPDGTWGVVYKKKKMEPEELESAVEQKLLEEYLRRDAGIKASADAERDAILAANRLPAEAGNDPLLDYEIKTDVVVADEFSHSRRGDGR